MQMMTKSTRPPSACGAEVESTSGVCAVCTCSSNVEDPELAPGAVDITATLNDRTLYPSNDDGVPGPYEYRRYSQTRGLRRFLKSAKSWGGPMIGVYM